MNPIFEKLVATSGLSPIFARSTMKRALERAGVNPETMTEADLEKARPSIQRVLDTFIPIDGRRNRRPGGSNSGQGGGTPAPL